MKRILLASKARHIISQGNLWWNEKKIVISPRHGTDSDNYTNTQYMRSLLLGISFILSSVVGVAQTLPSETIYFTTDRMVYQQSDSIGVEGILMRMDNDSEREPYSRVVYMEMINGKDSVMTRQRVMTDDNGAFQMKMPPAYAENGIYYLRAFTKMMCNFNEATIPTYPVEIRDVGFTAANSTSQNIDCRFFPEGGHLIAGEMQRVAVYLHDSNENGVQKELTLHDASGNSMKTITTTPSGWEVLTLMPTEGNHYYITVENDGGTMTFALPETEKDACTLKADVNKGFLLYSILGNRPQGSRLYAYHQGAGLLQLPDAARGRVDVGDLNDGVMSLILLGKDDNILSETQCWVGERAKENPALAADYNKGEIIGSLMNAGNESHRMVRFFPYEEYQQSMLRSHMTSAEAVLNYTNGLKSPVVFPTEYLSENAAERHTDITAWLNSASFCRFDIAKALENGFNYRYKPEVGNIIQGVVYGPKKAWKLKKGSIVAFQRSNGNTFSAEMNKDGSFVLPVDDYPEKEEFFLEAHDEKGRSMNLIYEITDDSIPSLRNMHVLARTDENVVVEVKESNSKFSFTGDNRLPEVTVKARVKVEENTPTKEFYGNKLLTQEVLEQRNYQSFEQMIYHFSPYMVLRKEASDDNVDGGILKKTPDSVGKIDQYKLFPVSRVSVLSGKSEIPIYVDGTMVETNEAYYNLNMDDVASAQFLSSAEAVGHYFGAINGVLEIKTKKYKKEAIKSKGVMYQPSMGSANYGKPYTAHKVTAPETPGRYVMIVDSISPDGTPQSSGYVINVK